MGNIIQDIEKHVFDFMGVLRRFIVLQTGLRLSVTWMRVSSFISEPMVLNRNKVECSLPGEDESLPLSEEFRYLWILVTSDGKLEQQIYRRIGALEAVMRVLLRSVVAVCQI